MMKNPLRNKTLLLTVAALVSVLLVFALLERWAGRKFKTVKFNPSVRLMIQREHPHVICVGNSMLGTNIDKKEFKKRLAVALGKPVRVSFILGSGLHTAWSYLILKNQIAPAAKTGTAIIFFDYEDYYTRPEANTIAIGKVESVYRRNMTANEPVFRSKIGASAYYFTSGFPYLYSQRYRIKRYLTSEFLRVSLAATGLKPKKLSKSLRPENEKGIAKLFSTVFRGSEFRSGQADDRERVDRILVHGESSEQFEAMVHASFLPDMIAFNKDFPLTFLLSNSNPSMTLIRSSLGTYSSRLREALEKRGVRYVDMNVIPELQEPGLMSDSRHYARGRGRLVNTQAVVDALVSAHAFDSLKKES